MWQWQIDQEDLTPTGYGICGGEIYLTECYSGSRSSSTAVAQLIAQPELNSISNSSSVLGLWLGTRGCYSGSRSSSGLDLSNGLTIFSDYDTVSKNVNTLRLGGEILGTNATINRYSDVTIRSLPTDSLDGAGGDIVSGGTSETTGSVIDGGNSEGVFSIVTFSSIPYYQIIDTVSDFLIYKGWAEVGSVTTNPVWRIQKVVIGFDEDVTKTWADGNAEFDNVWDNRLSLVYS